MTSSSAISQTDVQLLRAAAAAAWRQAPAAAGQVAFDWEGIRYRARFNGPHMIVLQPDGEVLVTIHGTSRASLGAQESQEPQERVALRNAIDQAIFDLENHRPLAKKHADAHAARLADLTGQLSRNATRLRHLFFAQLWVGGFGLGAVLLGIWLGWLGRSPLSGLAWQLGGFGLILVAISSIPALAKRAASQAQQRIVELETEISVDISSMNVSDDQRISLASIVAEEPAIQRYLDRWIDDAGGITAGDLAVIEQAIVPMRALKQYDQTQQQILGLISQLKGSPQRP